MTILSFIESFSYLGSFALLVLGALGLPFPEGTILIANGFLIAGHIVKPVYAVTVIFAGIILGDSLAYYFGRKYGEQILSIKFFRRIMTIEVISKFQKKFSNGKVIGLTLLGHLVSGVFIVAGVIKMPFSKFLAADVAVTILAMAIWIVLGYIGGESLLILVKDMRRVDHYFILLAIISLSLYLFFQTKKK